MTASSRIFVAHASEDKPAVRQLYRELVTRGFEPWLDSEDLLPGQAWKLEIPKAIRGAQVFLACLSSRSVAKVGYVQNEFRLALAAFGQRPPGSIYLIPARLDECEVPDLQIPDLGLGLRDVHWVDLFADDGIDRLVRALTDGAGIAPAARGRTDAPVPLQVFRDIDAPWCPEMVVIPAGRFVMGSSPSEEGRSAAEGPQHFVTIAEPFALGRYAVTFDEYDEFAATTGREPPGDGGWGRGRRPVINVSWNDAEAYTAWLSEQTGATYRLPSEAEWEYACRAGTTTPFHFGPTISTEQANYDGNYRYGAGRKGAYREQALPVGSFPANDFGLHDMHGNVWEWCADVWHDSYDGAPLDGSAWIEGGNQRLRVLRGGSWDNVPGGLRSADRDWYGPGDRGDLPGFRVARTLR
jgi:formylglycine-generating enzyme required for sulfatase activity